jgi:hypothetical protein
MREYFVTYEAAHEVVKKLVTRWSKNLVQLDQKGFTSAVFERILLQLAFVYVFENARFTQGRDVNHKAPKIGTFR